MSNSQKVDEISKERRSDPMEPAEIDAASTTVTDSHMDVEKQLPQLWVEVKEKSPAGN